MEVSHTPTDKPTPHDVCKRYERSTFLSMR